jgi:hypothetical protein
VLETGNLTLTDDLANVTQLQVDRARGLLRVLLGKEIVLHPTADGQYAI